MKLEQMETLLAIIDEGSFERAAAALGISAPAVSQRIKALEHSTGRVLVRRESPVTATEAGEVIAQAARRVALLQAETEAALDRRLASVPLNVAINADSLATWFPPVLREVATWDSASILMRIEDESHSLELLRSGDCLGAVTRESKPVSGCDSVLLGTLHYVAVAAPWLVEKYTLNKQIDWARMPALRFGPRDYLQDRDLVGRLDNPPKHRRVSIVPSMGAFLQSIEAGLGWAIVVDTQAKELIRRGVAVQLDDKIVSTDLYWQHWRLESPLLELLTSAVTRAARKNIPAHCAFSQPRR
ncbi:ArgP family transcriptional regulator [Corynebacterium pyruviciproducens ATCC BAA-1742]|uniref:ArgP family transcriptional regulator n=1 Tax=Corynebacterium pyruviciproducens ATCC BAA-1742 TaxID=1125779 RepID=S2ZKP9_9CORY|nr:LysR family transcriptional regulator ArgP [Corynebacterium pyruviciproducens]EPD70577.1 ArgP family transcriptional regulator [Corynebacterium pyruviciproducens ATCC BAA-1742]